MRSFKQYKLRLFAGLLITALAVGCGFQLRGPVVLSPALSPLSVVTQDTTTTFMRELTRQLQANGIQTRRGGDDAVSALVIEEERTYKQPLTISQDARVQEYMLSLEVQFSLISPDGEVWIDSQRMRATREYRFDEQAILAVSREEEFLEQNLSQQIARQMMQILASRSDTLP